MTQVLKRMTLPLLGLLFLQVHTTQANETGPVLQVLVDHPVLILSSKPTKPTTTKLTVIPLRFPPLARMTFEWKQVQDVLSPIAANLEKCPVQFSSTTTGSTVATFPDWGVYELQVTVTDLGTQQTYKQNTWVNIWDFRSHIEVGGTPDPLCVAPGITPPRSVRTLSPDPGPFNHPRLYCTDSEWPDIHQRCMEGFIPGNGYRQLNENIATSLDSDSSDSGKLRAGLEAYAAAGYQEKEPDLTMGIQPENQDGKPGWGKASQKLREFYGQIRDAAFSQWVKVDPHLPRRDVPDADQARFKQLATVLAAVCHLQLTKCWDEKTGKFNKEYPLYIRGLDNIGSDFQQYQEVALAYDFLATWMTPQEQKETRNFLFAVAAGRATGARDFPVRSNGITLNHGVERGTAQNGDFMNIEEEKVLSALVIDGEESGVDPQVVQTFTTISKPADYETSGKCYPYDWMEYTDQDNGRDNTASKPYPDGGNWPYARKVEVDNLQRMLWWNDDWYVSPWGFLINREGYYGYSAYGIWPVSVAYARHGAFNMFVGSNYYRTVIHLIYELYPGAVTQKSPHFSSNIYLYDHHDGGADSRQTHVLLMKYMYPDDPAVDYIYQSNAPYFENSPQFPFEIALFGMDPGINGRLATLPDLAKEKELPLTKLDPQVGVVVARSGWAEADTSLYFDDGWYHTGHMHAEKNSFSFFALGRPWTISPGYHVVPSNLQSSVMIQDPAWAKDPLTEGYLGESPSESPKGSPYPGCFPSPPGKLIEVKESADKLTTLMAGDAKTAYEFCYSGKNGKPEITPPWTRAEHMYPGLLSDLLSRLPDDMNKKFLTDHFLNIGWDDKINPGYNPVQYAFRSILFVRGAHPCALIVDDINKDNTPRNYRWTMNCSFNFGGPDGKFADETGKAVRSSLLMAPGSTSTQATLLHIPDKGDSPGLPRLLVEDLSEVDNHGQPPMVMNQTEDEYGPSNRLFIDRNKVVEPNYKILLYPYRTGDALIESQWNTDHTVLTLRQSDGAIDVLSFSKDAEDHRTRIKFVRKN